MRNRTTERDGQPRRRHWTEQEARAALAEFSGSAETMAAFARRTGISRERLRYWRKRIASRETTDFVAVELAGGNAERHLEIVAGGVVVRVPQAIDIDDVARLVEAIGRRVRR